jgi:hypothetical protein
MGRTAAVLAGLAVATVSTVTLRTWFVFESKVTADVHLAQVPFERRYRLVSSETGEVISDDVEGWYVEGRYVVGSEGQRGYFIFDRVCRRPWHFEDAIELRGALKKHDIGGYAWSKEEGTADVVFVRRQSAFRNSNLPLDEPRCRTPPVRDEPGEGRRPLRRHPPLRTAVILRATHWN